MIFKNEFFFQAHSSPPASAASSRRICRSRRATRVYLSNIFLFPRSKFDTIVYQGLLIEYVGMILPNCRHDDLPGRLHFLHREHAGRAVLHARADDGEFRQKHLLAERYFLAIMLSFGYIKCQENFVIRQFERCKYSQDLEQKISKLGIHFKNILAGSGQGVDVRVLRRRRVQRPRRRRLLVLRIGFAAFYFRK